MADSDRELEEQLMEVGNRLLAPPSPVDELLPLLDQVENCLSRVEQSPPKSMQSALSPSMKALVTNEFLKHPDVDVKVAVASCISEITRITAPDAPYDDDQMKEVFQLIVSSFENLSDKSSRSYNKRTTILETVAKVRSCVVMLDLECDLLIVEMFQHFLKAIRDYHPENVFSSMETIMTLVLEESEDISLDLLSPILASVQMDNEEFMPVAQKLGEKVFENCATKLKPYLIQAVKSLGISLDDYSKVVASICQETSAGIEHNDVNASSEHLVDESKLARASSEEQVQVAKEIETEVAHPGEIDPDMDRSPKSVMSNGIAQTVDDDSLLDSNSSKMPEHRHTNQSESTNVSSKPEPDSLDDGKVVKLESKPEQSTKRRGRKPNSLKNSTEPSDSSHVDGEKEAEKLPDRQKSRSKEVRSPREDPSVETAVPSENEKETGIQLSSPQALEREAVNVPSPSPSGSLPDESRLRKGGRPKKKESLIQEATPSAGVVSKKASEGTSDSEVKPQRRSGKKAPAGITNEDKTPAPVDASKKEGGTTSDSEAKSLKQSGKKGDASNNNEDDSSLKQLKQQEDRKRRGRGKAISEKDVTDSSAKNDKEMVSSPKSATKSTKDDRQLEETPKMNSKRKRTPGKEKTSDTKDSGEDLVGSKIKVWWPKDQAFYGGVVDSFDSVKKKHKVLYSDGDEEILNLKKERWVLVGGDVVSDEEQATDRPSPGASSEMHQKKKAKTNSNPSKKQGKMGASPKRSGGASSSKSKGAVTKSGRKSRDDGKIDGKSKDDNNTKTVSKSEDDNGGKSKDHTPKSGSKSIVDAPKLTGKSKDDDSETPKTSTKAKQDSEKTATKSKGKTSKTGSKSSANGTGKMKSGSSKVKESEDLMEKSTDLAKTVAGTGKVKSGSSKVKESEALKEKSPDLAKTVASAKGKSPASSKALDSEAKSGKKRRRGAKSG